MPSNRWPSTSGPPLARILIRHAYGTLVIAGLAAYIAVLIQQLGYGLEFDEAYNLTVVRNLANGYGYASNSAIFSGLERKAFDPFVSTGPALLMPAAVVWKLTGGTLWAVRLVPLAGFAVYLFAAWHLGKRISGRWGALLATLSPLALVTAVPDLTTRSLVPGRMVGEFAACGLSLLGAWALLENRPLAGGLCFGLVIQVKSNFIVAAGLALAIWIIGSAWPTRPIDWGATWRAAVGAAIPTLSFEVYRFAQLGPAGYVHSVWEFIGFLRSQSAGSVSDRLERVHSLINVLPAWGALFVVGATALLISSCAPQNVRPSTMHSHASPRMAFALVLVPASALLASWLLASAQSSVRQGLPFLLLVLPMLGAGIPLARRGAESDPPAVRNRLGPRKLAAGITVLILGGGAVISAVHAWSDSFGRQLEAEQRAAAQAIVTSGTRSLPVDEWWQAPEMQILTNLPTESAPNTAPATVRVFTSVQALIDRGRADARAYEGECGEVLYRSSAAVVCRPPFDGTADSASANGAGR